MIMRVVEDSVRDYGLSALDQGETWRRWREGESLSSIARGLGRPIQHVRRFLSQTGGIQPPVPRPAAGQLGLADREEISRGVASGASARQIAVVLGRPASTVSREIARHGGRERYRAHEAHAQAALNRRRLKTTKLADAPLLREVVEAKLALRWSPDQISGWLTRTHPDELMMQVSPETIYRSLFDPRRRDLQPHLTQRLRSGRAMRYPRRRRDTTGRGRIRDMLSIRDRPAAVEGRDVAGHWEGDLVMGSRPSAIATLVERTSRYVKLVALPGGIKPEQVHLRLAAALNAVPASLRGSLTWDRGREMATHAQFTVATGMPVYFCYPKSPWQRGSNENTNGLLRQYLPKSADLNIRTQAELDAIAHELNHRPRKIHGYRSNAELYDDLCQVVVR